MDTYEEKLRKLIAENNINAQVIHFDQTCHSAEDAARAVNGDIDQIVKSICLIDQQNNPVIAIIKGADKVSMVKVGKALQMNKPRPATKDEVLLKTGFPAGGTPPFGYHATFLIDPKVMEKNIVYVGGGSENAITKISPSDLLKVNKAHVIDICKENSL